MSDIEIIQIGLDDITSFLEEEERRKNAPPPSYVEEIKQKHKLKVGDDDVVGRIPMNKKKSKQQRTSIKALFGQEGVRSYMGIPCLAEGEYHGLSVVQQKALASKKRGVGSPPKALRKTLRKMKRADLDKLQRACVECIIAKTDFMGHDRVGQLRIVVKCPYNYKRLWDKDLPFSKAVAYSDWHIFVLFKVKELLDWMYTKGYSSFNAYDVVWQQKELTALENKIERYQMYATDGCLLDLYSDIFKGGINDTTE